MISTSLYFACVVWRALHVIMSEMCQCHAHWPINYEARKWANWNISQKWKVKILMTHIYITEKSDKDVKYSKNCWIALMKTDWFFRMKCRFLCGNTTQKTSKSLLRPCQRTCRGFLSGAKNSWWIHLPIHLSTDFFEETSVITAPLTTPITSASGCRFVFGNYI